MNDSIPDPKFDPGTCIFTSPAFAALLAHRVRPGLLVNVHAALWPGTMNADQLHERLKAVLCGGPVVSRYRLPSKVFGPAAADLVLTTGADRQTTIVTLASED